MKLQKQTLLILILTAIVCILLWRGCNQKYQLEEQIALYEASSDTLTKTRNKLGEEVTKTELLVADNEKDLLKMKTQDSTIMQLQKTVKKYKGDLANASVFNNNTTNAGTSSTTVFLHDTIIVNGQTLVYPTYESDWKDKWSKGKIVATKDSISREFTLFNEFVITQGYEKQGFLKSKKATVSIKNLNPNTVTTELKSFTIEEKPKPVRIGAGAMYGIDLLRFKPSLVVGVGAIVTIEDVINQIKKKRRN